MQLSMKILPQLHMFTACFSCYVSMILCGICLSWVEPLTVLYKSKDSPIPMTDNDVALMTSLVEAGAFFSPLPSASMADHLGRKWTMVIFGIIALIGFLLSILVENFAALCTARVLAGLTLGALPTVAPVYMVEIAPAAIRGTLSGQLITMFFLGQVIVYATGHYLPITAYMWICAAVPMVFIVTSLPLPESPYYLLKKGKDEQAKKSLEKLRGAVDDQEFDEMATTAKQSGSELSIKSQLIQLCKWSILKILLLLQLLSFISHMNGLPTLSLYATETFGGSAWLTVSMGGLLAGSSFIAAFLTDPIGRRPLLISSLAGSALFTAIIAAYFIEGQHYGSILYVGVFGFCVVSSVGISPLIMTLQGELFPTSVRAIASAITELTLSLSSFICLYIYLPINEQWGFEVNFIIYTVLSLIGVVAVLFFLPETSRVSIQT